MKPCSLVAIAGLFSGIVGFVIGHSSSGEPVQDSPSQNANVASHALDTSELIQRRELPELRPEAAAALKTALDLAAASDLIGALKLVVSIKNKVARAEAVLGLIARLDAAQLGALMPLVMSAGQSEGGEEDLRFLFDDELVYFALFDRWAEVDPDGVETHLLSGGVAPESKSGMMMRALPLMSIAQRDPDRAIALLDKLRAGLTGDKDGKFAKRLGEFVMAGIAASDPGRAMRMLRDQKVDFAEYGFFAGLFGSPGVRVGEMLGELLQLPAGQSRQTVMDNLFYFWGDKDPQAALAAANQLSEDDGREHIVAQVLESYAKSDPEAAGAYLNSLEPGDERDRLATQLVGEWMKQGDPGAALAWAETNLDTSGFLAAISGGGRLVAPEVGMAILSEMDPETRALFFRGTAKNRDSLDFVERAAEADAVATLTWLREFGGFEAASGMGHTFGREAASQDLKSALAIIDALPPGRFRDAYVEQVAMIGGRDDPQQTADWSPEPDPALKTAAFSRVLEAWAWEDPQVAANYALEHGDQAVATVIDSWSLADAGAAYRWLVETEGGDPQALAKHLDESKLMEAWLGQNPAAAAEAMAGFPAELAPARVAKVISAWAATEPTRASAFIADRMGPSPARDAAVVALVEQINRASPAKAAEWVQSISDPELRDAVRNSLSN